MGKNFLTFFLFIRRVTLTIRKLEQEILAAGGHVCILTTRSGSVKNTHLDGEHPNRRVLFLDDAIKIPFASDPSNPESVYFIGFSLSPSVIKEIDNFSPTLVHITVPDVVSLDVIQYARENDLPLMGTFHSNYVDYLDHYGLFWIKPCLISFFQHQYSFYQALYCPTPFIQKQLGHPDKKFDLCTNVQVWGRGIDLEKFNPKHRSMSFRAKYSIAPDEVVICFVGRLVFEKRPDIFAYVMRRLSRELEKGGVRFRGLVVGCGPYETELQNCPNTVCTGWLSGEELATAYASSDIFLFPSALETFGNVTLEAASSGLPLVVESGCSGHLVKDGINGYACPEGDEESFLRGTLELVTDASRRKQFSLASREHSFLYEKRAVMKQMLTNYETVTDEFYRRYNGSHNDRDDSLRDSYPQAFTYGKVERPCALRVFISCFVFVIQALFCMYMQFGCLFESLWRAISSVRSMGTTSPHKREEGMDDIEKGNITSATATSSSKVNEPQGSPEMAPWKGISCIYRTSELVMMTVIVFLRIQSSFEYTLRTYFRGKNNRGEDYSSTRRKDTLEDVTDVVEGSGDSGQLRGRRRNIVEGEKVAAVIGL